MHFMILRKADTKTEAGAMPGGPLLDALQPSSEGVRVKFFRGKPSVTEGPFPETNELVAGFTVIEANSKDEAIEWAKRWPALDGEGEVEIEIRGVGCPGLRGISPSKSSGASAPNKRFMVLLKADKNLEAGLLPNQNVLALMGTRNDESVKAGIMLAGEGLLPTSHGARVKFSRGKPAVIDGPFTEAKELVAGYWIIQAQSKEEAVEWVKRYPYPSSEAEVEIRQVSEMSDLHRRD